MDENKNSANLNKRFITFETVTMNDWDIKISRMDDQLLVAIQNRDTGLTDVRFFTNEYRAYHWIDYVTNIEV